MSRRLSLYVTLLFIRFLGLFYACAVSVFLVADFVDRAKAYTGPNWVADVAVLYGYKALTAAQQLGPAVLLLAAGATVSALKRRGELTAIMGLGFGPRAVYLPVGLCTLLVAILLFQFDERIVADAGRKVDEITTNRFKRWGDWRFHFQPKQWFRVEERIFHLRGGSLEQGYEQVMVLTLTDDFSIASRLDADRMTFKEGTRWELVNVMERKFLGSGRTELRTVDREVVDLRAGERAFEIRQGRPEQMRLRVLRHQRDARERVGLPARPFSFAIHNRFSYPASGWVAALLSLGLALRPGRRGGLTASVVESLMLVLALWGLMVISKALVLSERLTPWVAAWLPTFLFGLIAAALWAHREGRLSWKRA
jgi:lipopolysaccharide export system permease protein